MSDPTRILEPMRTLIQVFVVCSVAAASTCLVSSPPMVRADLIATTALVLKVVDGDTIDIRDDNRGRLRVRLLGIDTPETKKPNYTVGCWGPEATEFAKSTMLGQRVALVPDPTQDMTDRYGRHWPTWTRLTGGTIRSKPLELARPTPTSITATLPRGLTRSQQPNKRRRPAGGGCGDRRALVRRPQFRADGRQLGLLGQVDDRGVSRVLLHRVHAVFRGGLGLVSLTDSDDLAVADLQPEPVLADV
jgi:hypothetical protein